MKKAGVAIILLIALTTAIVILTYNRKQGSVVKVDGFYISQYAKISAAEWQALDYPGNRFKSAESLLMEVDDYVEAISVYLGKQTGWIITRTSIPVKSNCILPLSMIHTATPCPDIRRKFIWASIFFNMTEHR